MVFLLSLEAGHLGFWEVPLGQQYGAFSSTPAEPNYTLAVEVATVPRTDIYVPFHHLPSRKVSTSWVVSLKGPTFQLVLGG